MRRKICLPALLLITVLLTFCALTPQILAQEFKEGVHYEVVSGHRTANAESGVVEYFSFSCPGCYAIEPSIKRLAENLPAVSLKRVHTPFGGRKARYSQKAFALVQQLKAETLKQEIFERIHLQRNVFDDDEELVEFFAQRGHQAEKVRALLTSFSTDTMIRRMNKSVAESAIQRVPSIIVNGKYQVVTRELKNSDDLTSLIRYLTDLGDAD